MLRNIFVIFTLFAAVYCSGEMRVLSTSDAVQYKQSESKLKCSEVDSLLRAIMGYTVHEPADFKGAYIMDPTGLPEHIVFLTVKGTKSIDLPMKTPTFPVVGTGFAASIALTMKNLQDAGLAAIEIDLSRGPKALEEHEDVLGKLKVNIDDAKYNLSTSDPAEKSMAEQIAAMYAVTKGLSSNSAPALTHVSVSFEAVKNNPETFKKTTDCYTVAAKKMISTLDSVYGDKKTTFFLYTTKDDVLTTEPEPAHTRTRREAGAKEDDLNLAKAYDDNYPVIFNIILWFGVVIAFSLYAVSYAIATMDPGRDSIIYRMTSTRIKKDN